MAKGIHHLIRNEHRLISALLANGMSQQSMAKHSGHALAVNVTLAAKMPGPVIPEVDSRQSSAMGACQSTMMAAPSLVCC